VLAYRHGIVAEIAASELDGGIDHAKEMMRNTWRYASRIKSDRKLKLGIGELAGRGEPETVLLVQRNLVGEDVKTAVDLHGVSTDHLDAGEVSREVDGQPRLAGARGAHHNHHIGPPPLWRRRWGVDGSILAGVWSRRRGGGVGGMGHLQPVAAASGAGRGSRQAAAAADRTISFQACLLACGINK